MLRAAQEEIVGYEIEKLAERFDIDRRELRRWLIEAMVLGGVADGELDQRESDRIIVQVTSQPVMVGIGADELYEDLDRAVTGLIADGFRARAHALAGALPRYAHRVLAFRGAVTVAFANGRLDAGEFDILRTMQSAMGITEADVTLAFELAQDEGDVLGAAMEPVEAYLDCLLMAAAANRRLASEELATIIAFVLSRDEFDGIDEDRMREYIHARLAAFSHGEIEERLELLADELPEPAQRENAYGLAVSVAVSDGELDEAEVHFLAALREALDLDHSRVELVHQRLSRS